MTLLASIRTLCGNSFPRMGRSALEIACKWADGTDYEVFPGIQLRLNGKDDVQKSIFWSGARFEYPTALIFKAWGGYGATHFFDIGSNIGFFSYWMRHNFPLLEIHAFEPNPATYAYISGVCSANKIEKMQCHPIGLSDLEDSLDLHPGVEDSGHSTFGNHPQLKTEVIQKILVKSFDQWRREQGMLLPDKPAWVAKIDVEGFEEKVLQGMKEALEHRAFIGVAVELNTFTLEFCDSSVEKIEEILTNCGYTPMSRTSRFGLWPLEKTANSFWIPWEFAK